MEEYEHCVSIVLDYLMQSNYSSTVIHAYKKFFKNLQSHFEEIGADYTPEEADVWYESTLDSLSKSKMSRLRLALSRLHDAYIFGCISPEHDAKHIIPYAGLCDDFQAILAASLEADSIQDVTGCYKPDCVRFFLFMQSNRVFKICDISYDLIVRYFQDYIRSCKTVCSHMKSSISSLMGFLFELGIVPYGFTIIIHYLSVSHNRGCYWNNISAETHDKISLEMKSSHTVDTDTLCCYRNNLYGFQKDNGYSKTVITASRNVIELLILFLEMNDYRYNPEISMLWFADTRQFFGTQAGMYHRALCLIEDYHASGHFPVKKTYNSCATLFSRLPEWCRKPADLYIDEKTKEGWSRSTISLIRCSVSSFCSYLGSIGISSFMDLNAEHIKQFNASDIHKTPQGKNAYNVRIRHFLSYLGAHGYLANPMLFASLTKISAPRETIVVVLTEKEMTEMQDQLDSDGSGLSLRNKAILLLGLKMGLRASDIVNLDIDDVNWNTASIRFVQKKTSVEVNLPMPAEVGNALFRYITEERYPRNDRKIFLSENAPHDPVGRSACTSALDAALPDRDVNGSGFHVTRKTYATGLLQKGVGAPMVAEALGQSDTSSVHRYLSLDSGRMSLCAMSLSDFDIGGLHLDQK